MTDPDITAAAQAILPLMPSDVKKVAWEKLPPDAQDRLRQIAQVCCDAAYPPQDAAPST